MLENSRRVKISLAGQLPHPIALLLLTQMRSFQDPVEADSMFKTAVRPLITLLTDQQRQGDALVLTNIARSSTTNSIEIANCGRIFPLVTLLTGCDDQKWCAAGALAQLAWWDESIGDPEVIPLLIELL